MTQAHLVRLAAMLWVVSSAGALVGTARGDSRLLAVAAVSGLASAAVLIRDRLGW